MFGKTAFKLKQCRWDFSKRGAFAVSVVASTLFLTSPIQYFLQISYKYTLAWTQLWCNHFDEMQVCNDCQLKRKPRHYFVVIYWNMSQWRCFTTPYTKWTDLVSHTILCTPDIHQKCIWVKIWKTGKHVVAPSYVFVHVLTKLAICLVRSQSNNLNMKQAMSSVCVDDQLLFYDMKHCWPDYVPRPNMLGS